MKEIIQRKRQKQCDENKDTNTDGNSIKNRSKQESHEQADTVLVLGKRGAGGGVCVCVLNQPFPNLAQDKPPLVIQLGQ